METKSLRDKLLPHLIIIGTFFVICCIYFSPVFKHKILQQHDTVQFLGSSKEAIDYNKQTGKVAYWTNSMFGGMPTYQIALGYPKSTFIVGAIYTFFVKVIPHPINSVFFCMLGFYLFLLSYKIDKWTAAIGAIAFGLSSYNFVIINAGHVNKSYAIAWAPFVLAAINYTYRSGKYLSGAALLALAFTTELKCNHMQITYYLILIIAFYLIFELVVHVRQKAIMPFLRATVFVGLAMALAFGANFTNLYITNEYAKQTIRGGSELTQTKEAKSDGLDKEYALDWSYGLWETGTIMIPNIRGGSNAAIGNEHPEIIKDIADQQVQQVVANSDEYWGVEPATGVIYFGSIVCFLFVLGLLVLEGPEKWWLLGATLLSIMLAWGKYFMPLTDFFFNYFPFYNKFRSVSMIMVIASITMPILGFLVLDRIIKSPEILKRNMKKFYIALGLTAGFCLLFWLIPSFTGDFLKPDDADMKQLQQGVQQSLSPDQAKQFMASPQPGAIMNGLQEARESILKSDAIRSFLFIVLAGLLLWLFSKGRIKDKRIVIAGICLLVLIDLWSVDRRYLNNEAFKSKQKTAEALMPSPADDEIMRDQDPDYRVLNLTLSWNNDATTSYFHKSIGGYHGAKLRRIQDLISNQIGNDINKYAHGQKDSATTLNMLNTKYIIFPGNNPQTPPIVDKNTSALGNAWFIKNVKIVENADKEMESMHHLSAKDEGVVNKRFAEYFQGGPTQWQQGGNIKLDTYSPNELSYSYNSPSDGFVVFSEIYYNPNNDWHKGDWQASIDGKATDHIRIDYVLRGMKVPAGNHKIEFKFAPRSYFMGENVAFASSILMLLLVGGAIFTEVRKKKEPGVEA